MQILKWFMLVTLAIGCVSNGNQLNPQDKLPEQQTSVEDDNKEENIITLHEQQENIESAGQYIGKHLLVGLTYRDDNGEVIKRVQLHGIITRITKEGIFIERADGNGEFTLPSDLESLEPTIPGAEYRINITGEVVRDADYMSNWTIDMPPEEDKE